MGNTSGTSETIGFIGMGQLSLPMATNLLQAGYAPRVYNRTASKAAALVAQGVFDFGVAVGAGNMVKLVGNFLIVSAGYAMSEALRVARDNGLDLRVVVDMLTSTLFAAPIYQSYGKRIAEGAASFGQSQIPLKDVGLFQQAAHQPALPTPIANLLSELLRSDEGDEAEA